MKNIAVGINIFDEYKRQSLCIDSLHRLADKHPNVKLYNIQQAGGSVTIDTGFETIYDNGRTAASEIDGCTMGMPIVNDFFNALAQVDCDYFIFLNSDIILTSKVIKLIEENDYDTISLSRLAIHEIDTIDEKDIKHEHFQIAGFDVWALKKNWWLQNNQLFPDYIYAISAWDVDFSARMMVLGNSFFDTEFPPGCFHIIHEEKAHDDTPERRYNVDLFFKQSKMLCDAWHKYLFTVIERRRKMCPNYTVVSGGEQQLIEEIFKNETLHSFCRGQNKRL